jgi:cytochrome c553
MSNVRWRHSFWLWVSIALAVPVLALVTRSAAAQTARGTQFIERALAAEPDQRSGARIYRERCASCHGSTAHGSADPVTPSLAGQQALYLIKQMADFAEGERTAPEMHRIVALKELSTHRYSVPFEVIDVLESVPFDTLMAIADYASRLPPRAATTPAATNEIRA